MTLPRTSLVDLHNDAALKLIAYRHEGVTLANGLGHLHVDFEKIREAEPDALFFACYCDPCFTGEDAFEIAQAQAVALKAELEREDSPIELALSAKDLDWIRKKGKTAGFLTVEGGYPIVDDLSVVDRLYEMGIRLMTLTHVKATPWAGSDGEEPDRALTELGEDVVRRMNSLGMIVDVAHTSTQTMLAACRVSDRPVIYSHGGVQGLVPTTRSISDEAIDAIAESGGVVALSFFPPHLRATGRTQDSPSPLLVEMERLSKKVMSNSRLGTIEKFGELARVFENVTSKPPEVPGLEILFENIDYLVKRVGDEFVALGGDYDGIPFACQGIEDLSKIRRIAEYMDERGYGQGRIEKIMGGNALRVIREVL